MTAQAIQSSAIDTREQGAPLAAALRGEVIQPGDAGYDAARTVYNGMIDKRPAIIARCVDVADVIAAVNFARDHGLLLAVRG
ncbi:MAG: FAD-dependent oxidoreductase, partial [Chloroflexota bacterium]|nr:FAD-dependent oxidoreductase [Chloroflexota bacterium]